MIKSVGGLSAAETTNALQAAIEVRTYEESIRDGILFIFAKFHACMTVCGA